MGKIKKILENELVGGTQNTDVYPVTSIKAVYDENNERLDHILNRSVGSIFSIIGNGTTVVKENNALKGLTIGKKYKLYAEKWAMSEISDSQNVIQLYYYQDGIQLVTQIKKSEMPNALDIEFTAVVSNYLINLRGNVDTIADFKIREYDYSLDEPIKDLKDTYDIINLKLPYYQETRNFSIIGNGSTIVQQENIISGLTIGNRYVLFAKAWSATDRMDDNIIFQMYYSLSGSIKVVKRYIKFNVIDFICFDFVAESESYSIQFYGDSGISVPFNLCSYDNLSDYILSLSQQIQNKTISIVGNGKTVVRKIDSIVRLIPGEKYNLYAEKWAMTSIDDSAYVLQLYYHNPDTVVIQQYKKSECPDYIDIEFIAVTDNVSINMRADVGVTVPFYITKKNNRLDHKIDEVKFNTTENYWVSKSIAWYGTSIPAGGYPQRVASILKAMMYNYAKGSSGVTKGGSYLAYDRNMGHTIAEKVAAVKDIWTIDDANQTFTAGPRTMGMTDIPNYTTYAQVKAARLSIITASYEVILLVRTLLSDSTERTAFLQNSLGDLYNQMMTDHASSFEYHKTDLWVFDHGHNDDCGTDPTQIDMLQVNRSTFVGAMNYYIGLVYQYINHPRIVIISDYDNFDNYYKKYTIETQQAIADRWHLPIIRIDKYLPFNINTKIRTRGYWDAFGYWHDTGFVWGALDGNMIGNGHFPNYIIQKFYESGRPPRTIEELTVLLNPSQDAAGNWWYDLEPRYIWLFDGLHPHSTKSGYALQMYAEPLAVLLKEIGTNGGY